MALRAIYLPFTIRTTTFIHKISPSQFTVTDSSLRKTSQSHTLTILYDPDMDVTSSQYVTDRSDAEKRNFVETTPSPKGSVAVDCNPVP